MNKETHAAVCKGHKNGRHLCDLVTGTGHEHCMTRTTIDDVPRCVQHHINLDFPWGYDTGTPVKVEWTDGTEHVSYGYIAAGPLLPEDVWGPIVGYEDGKAVWSHHHVTYDGFIYATDIDSGEPYDDVIPYRWDEVTETPGCECGNEFALCHPDA